MPSLGAAVRLLWKHRTVTVLVAAGLLFAWQEHRVSEAREARVNAELRLDSLEAAEDTTREVPVDVLRENVRAFQRRIVQVREMTADSVEEDLESDPRFRGNVTAAVDSLVVEEAGETTVEDDDVRLASFNGYREPYHFEADVRVPPPNTTPPKMRLRVQLDEIPLTVRVGCGEASEDREVRPAEATVTGPEWATIRLDGLRQSVDVCNRRVVDPEPGWELYASGVAAGATSGVVLAEDPTWQDAALGAGVGLVTSFAAEQAMSVVGLP